MEVDVAVPSDPQQRPVQVHRFLPGLLGLGGRYLSLRGRGSSRRRGGSGWWGWGRSRCGCGNGASRLRFGQGGLHIFEPGLQLNDSLQERLRLLI